MFKGVFDAVNVFGGGGVAEGEAKKGWELADFVEIIVGAEVAGARHDVLFAEGGAEEVRIHTVDIEGHGGVGLGADHMNLRLITEKIVKFLSIGEKVSMVFLSVAREPVDSGAEGDNFGPSLETGLEDRVGVVFVLSREEVVIGENVVDHASTDEVELKLWDEIAPHNHDAERGGIHFVGGETDSVGVDLFEESMVVSHGLGGVDNDNTFVLVDFFDEIFEVNELLAVKIGGAVDNNKGVFEVEVIVASLLTGDVAETAGEREATIVVTLEDNTGDFNTFGESHGSEEGGVVLDVGGDDLLDVFRIEFIQEEVEAVSGVKGEGDEVIFRLQLEEFEDLGAGVGYELVGLFAPWVFDAFAAGIVVMVIFGHGVEDGLGAEALTGGVEVGGFGVEIGEVVHIYYYTINLGAIGSKTV